MHLIDRDLLQVIVVENWVVHVKPAHVGASELHFLFRQHSGELCGKFSNVGGTTGLGARRKSGRLSYPIVVGEEAIYLNARDDKAATLRDGRIMATNHIDPPTCRRIGLCAVVPGGPKSHGYFSALCERTMTHELGQLVGGRSGLGEIRSVLLELVENVLTSRLLLFRRKRSV